MFCAIVVASSAMIHQARPVPAHLSGQESVRFSINQILSPASETSVAEEENQGYPYFPPGQFTGKQSSYHDNEQFTGYIYPKLENYLLDKWGDSRYPGRFSDASLYYHGYGGKNSNYYSCDVTGSNLKTNAYPESKAASAGGCVFNNSPLRSENQDAMTSTPLVGASPERPFACYTGAEYSPLDVGCEQSTNDLQRPVESGFSGAFNAAKCLSGSWGGISRNGATNSCGTGSFPNSTASYSSQFHHNPSVTSSSGGSFLGIPPHSGLSRPSLLAGNFPWMESRRERIARKFTVNFCFYCGLFMA